ncbi:MAG: hypothetical protein KKB30_10495 [Proteobacteria bacterium]|nr:hypothetical protein [Pseudomonadota bacterium]MBU1717066.1 hypothetical protein [Pseudomonadota bacterium]
MTETQKKWDDIMYSAISETIESMAFMEVIPTDDSHEPEKDCLCVSLLVHDPVQGEFELFMGRDLITMLADTVYGPVMAEVSDQNIFDLLAEILNTVVGRFMSDILPEDTSFKLGVPEICVGDCSRNTSSLKKWEYIIEDFTFGLTVTGESLLKLRNTT